VGVAGGQGKGVIFRNGEIVATCAESELEKTLMKEIDRLVEERQK
jgi:(E)-4-hydroxy-3-methylbut-2-enyl-diphosphate synthase